MREQKWSPSTRGSHSKTVHTNRPVLDVNLLRMFARDVVARRKTLVRFTAAEGAGDHCEGSACSVYFQRAYDWLDDVFGMR